MPVLVPPSRRARVMSPTLRCTRVSASRVCPQSQVMDFAFELMDRIGARLSGSPNLDRAVSWAVDRLTQVGLDDVRRDRWGEFGMAWRQRSTWVTLDEPDRASLPATAVPCDCASFEEAGIPPPLLVQDRWTFPHALFIRAPIRRTTSSRTTSGRPLS